MRLGREHHPDQPYDDPRVNVITDDARHFLRTTTKKYDLVVFALIDSLTLQSSFTSVRLESYMFTEESFRAVRDRLKPRRRAGASTTTSASGGWSIAWPTPRPTAFGTRAARPHPQGARYLGVMMVGPRPRPAAAPPPRRPTRRGLQPARRGQPGRAADARRRRRRRRPTTGRSSTCATAACRGTTCGRWRSCWWCRWSRSRGALRGTSVGVLVALLLPRRRLHAARDQVDHPVRAVVGLDVGRRPRWPSPRCW